MPMHLADKIETELKDIGLERTKMSLLMVDQHNLLYPEERMSNWEYLVK